VGTKVATVKPLASKSYVELDRLNSNPPDTIALEVPEQATPFRKQFTVSPINVAALTGAENPATTDVAMRYDKAFMFPPLRRNTIR
jgi:hypothetical protein